MPNKRMQTGRSTRHASETAADAGRYAASPLVTCNGMGYTLTHDSELQTQRIGEVFYQGNRLRYSISP
jgi:hypothetical protein